MTDNGIKWTEHGGGYRLPDRGDGFYWFGCHFCGKKWAHKEKHATTKVVRGSRKCSYLKKKGLST